MPRFRPPRENRSRSPEEMKAMGIQPEMLVGKQREGGSAPDAALRQELGEFLTELARKHPHGIPGATSYGAETPDDVLVREKQSALAGDVGRAKQFLLLELSTLDERVERGEKLTEEEQEQFRRWEDLSRRLDSEEEEPSSR